MVYCIFWQDKCSTLIFFLDRNLTNSVEQSLSPCHTSIVSIPPVEPWLLQQPFLPNVLLQDGIHDTGNCSVDGVVQNKEGAFKEGLGTVVGVEHVQHLTVYKCTVKYSPLHYRPAL